MSAAAVARCAAAIAVACLVLTAAGRAQAATYSGAMTLGAGAVREGSQGGFWQSRFREHRRGRVRYSACVVFLERKGTASCHAGRTGAGGVGRLFFAPFVNAHPGRWVVRFFVVGHQVAGWRFRVRGEGS